MLCVMGSSAQLLSSRLLGLDYRGLRGKRSRGSQGLKERGRFRGAGRNNSKSTAKSGRPTVGGLYHTSLERTDSINTYYDPCKNK